MKAIFATLLILSVLPASAGSKFRALYDAEVEAAQKKQQARHRIVESVESDHDEVLAAMDARLRQMEFQRQRAEQQRQQDQFDQQRLQTQRKMDQWQRDVQQKNRESQQRINQQWRDH